MDDTRSVDVIVEGRVQGVGYRAWTRLRAQAHGLSGHVRNRADGSVAAAFSGPSDAVAAMIEECRAGPPGARVDRVSVEERGHDGSSAGFAIAGA